MRLYTGIPFIAGAASMARPSNLSLMSVDALLKLRDDIGAVLSRRADDLKGQLSRLTSGGDIGNGRRGRGRALKGRKVAAKYRDREGNTWAGRGAQPRWLTAAIKAGAKREDFLIDKSAAASRKIAKKTRRRRKK
jgi:DNA-binding protein H-NS